MIIAVNDFVKRQVKDSGKTYARSMSFDSIAKHAEDQMSKGCFSTGYRDGVRIVHADSSIIDDFAEGALMKNHIFKLVQKMVNL